MTKAKHRHPSSLLKSTLHFEDKAFPQWGYISEWGDLSGKCNLADEACRKKSSEYEVFDGWNII